MKLRPQLALVLIVLALIAPSAFAQSFYWNTASARSTRSRRRVRTVIVRSVGRAGHEPCGANVSKRTFG